MKTNSQHAKNEKKIYLDNECINLSPDGYELINKAAYNYPISYCESWKEKNQYQFFYDKKYYDECPSKYQFYNDNIYVIIVIIYLINIYI